MPDCIWKETCEIKPCEICEYYYYINDNNDDDKIEYYNKVLKENNESYNDLIREFSDGE